MPNPTKARVTLITMTSSFTPLVVENLLNRAITPDQLPWQPLRSGVDICSLHQDGETGYHWALLRYQPGASVPLHHHPGYEQILVLSGQQKDDRGTYGPGSLIINLPGSQHQVTSAEGCVVLIFWQQPVVFNEP